MEPAAKPVAPPRAASEAPAPPDGDDQEARDEACRRAYLRQRDAILQQAGLGEFAGGWAGSTEAPPAPSTQHEAEAEAAARAEALLRAASGGAPMEVRVEADPGPVLSYAEASANALDILNALRRDVGRSVRRKA